MTMCHIVQLKFLIGFHFILQFQKYDKNSMVEFAMGAVRTILNTHSPAVRQLPPQIIGLYGKSRAGFPLGFGHASSYAGRGVVLIG